ncbi:glycosyltransferase family 2 protein [Geminocystis sp.]|uniref:glycosyltransferase family 2 protein n=1 Tax=Geminocystis sp. TaxID=2664100 RepID=UPI0035937CA2
MTNNHLVSCVIIFFNQEKFIEDAIGSILAQTYQNWELFLVDDGSTDNSSKIAQNYAKKYGDKIKYLQHENHQNRGKNASRNLGIDKSKGDYIAFLDGDDVWLPHKLQQQVEIFYNYPSAKMIYGRTLFWYSWTTKPEDKNKDYFMNLGVNPNTLIYPPDLLILSLQNKTQTPTTCNAIFRREVLEIIGKWDENFGNIYEDQIFFSQVQLKMPIFVADEYWAKYRRHSDNSTAFLENLRENIEEYSFNRLIFLNWVQIYLKSEKVKNIKIWLSLFKDKYFCEHPQQLRWWLFYKNLFLLGNDKKFVSSSSSYLIKLLLKF